MTLSAADFDLAARAPLFADLGRRCADAPDRSGKVRKGMYAMLAGWLDEHGFPRDEAQRHYLLDDDVELNSQGIEVWLDRK